MPFGTEGEEDGIGLALSGGGYRAMLFHLGVLRRLNEIGLLSQVARVSSVSGGSLTAGRLATAWKKLDFQDGVAANFDGEVAEPILRFSRRLVDVPAAVIGLLPFIGPGDVAGFFYRSLAGTATLQDLPDTPRFVFNSAHLASGTSWRFSKPYMGSYRVGLIPNPRTKVTTAMAASAAFPPVLSPVILRPNPGEFEQVEGADLYPNEGLRKLVALADGGVYDNLGLETLSGRYNTLLVSDASGGLAVKPGSYTLPPFQLMRVLDTATEQARALRRRNLKPWSQAKAGRRYAFWGTITDVSEYPAPSPFPVHPDWRFEMAAIRTRLNRFGDEERERLVNWGYLVSDVALRSFIAPDAAQPSALPFPRYDFASPPKASRSTIAGPA